MEDARHNVDRIDADWHVGDNPGDHEVGHKTDGEEGHHCFKGEAAIEIK